MAAGHGGAGGPEADLTQAQIAALKAQTGLTQAQINQIAQENALKNRELQQRGQIAQEGFTVDREKIGLGREEMTSKDKQAKLAAALEAIGIGSKEKIAGQSERAGLQADLTRRADIPQDVLARTLAAGGNPELFNAFAKAKLDKENHAVRSYIPPILAARSDAEREKKYKPALEAIRPGAYQEALALAYPKAGQAAPSATPEPAPAPTVPTGGGDSTNPLAAVLLAAAGFGGGAGGGNGGGSETRTSGVYPAGNGAPMIGGSPVLPSNRLIQHGQIYNGPPGQDLNINTGEWVPSNTQGTINGKPSGQYLAEHAHGVEPESPSGRIAYAQLLNPQAPTNQVAQNVPVPQGAGELVPPPAYDFGKLLTNNNGAATVNPTPTPAPPVVRQGPSPEELAALAEQEQQRKLREALALQAQNAQ